MKVLILEDKEAPYLNIAAPLRSLSHSFGIPEMDISDFFRSKYEVIEEKLTDYELIFVDHKLWETGKNSKDGIYYGKLCREKNPNAFMVLATAYIAKIKTETDIFQYYNEQIQKPVQPGDIEKVLKSFIHHRNSIEQKELLGNFKYGPKKGKFFKDKEYYLFYLKFIEDKKNIQEVDSLTDLWLKEIKRFVINANYKVSPAIVNSWKIQNPFSKRAIKNNKTNSLFMNILVWRRVILQLYEEGVVKGLPLFVEHSDIKKAKAKKREAIQKYKISNDESYNYVCLKSIYALQAIHSYGSYSDTSFNFDHENKMKSFISNLLGFTYKTPYIQYDRIDYLDLFEEEVRYLKSLGYLR